MRKIYHLQQSKNYWIETKFHSNYHGVPRNIAVAEIIGQAKYCRKIAPNKISLNIVKCLQISFALLLHNTVITVIEFMFLGINIFWALLRAHFRRRV